MYSPKVINQNLESLLPQAIKLTGNKKLVFTEHSIEQVESANKLFDKLKGENNQFKRQLEKDEQEWIVNERLLCKFNFRYFCTRYAYIKGLKNIVQRFNPNIAQNIVIERFAETEERNVEILQQYLKARRLGISTLSELCIGHRIWFYPHVTGIVGSSEPKNTGKMHKMMMFAYEHLPFWLRPEQGHYKTDAYYNYSNGSYLSLEHGTQFADIGRGSDPSCFHLSECAEYDKPEELIESGLMRAVIPDPFVFGILEGTANGDDGWWYDQYHHNKKYYSKNKARFEAEFLPWFTGVDIYPSEAEMRRNPIPEGWVASPATQHHADHARDYVSVNPSLKKHLGDGWTMPREQQYFYETNIEEYRLKKITHLWSREMAADDEEAWQTGQLSVFDAELLIDYRNSVSNPCEIPGYLGSHAVFGLRGNGIPQEMQPRQSEIQEGIPIIKVKVQWSSSRPVLNFEFVPLKFNGYSGCSPAGKLFVWEWPQIGNTYEWICDTAEGLGEDRSDNTTIEVLRKGDRFRLDAQVAEFASPDVSGDDLWPYGIAIGTFFSVIKNGKLKQAKCVPEINRDSGRALARHLVKWGWREFYMHIAMDSTRRQKRKPEIGWLTSPANRGDMLQIFMGAVNRKRIELNSPWLISEMGTFIKDDSGKLVAAKGKKDDRLMGTGIGLVSLYEVDARSPDHYPSVERNMELSPEEKYPVYRNSLADHAEPELTKMINS